MKESLKKRLDANKEAWSDLFYIIGKELYIIFRDKGVLLVFFIACAVYPLACGLIYNKEMMRDMPIAVVDLSQSSLSRDFLRQIDATPEVKITNKCFSLEDAKQLQKESKVHGIILIPQEFSSKINTLQQAHISLYADVTSFFWYRNLMLSTNFVTQSFGHKIQVERMIAKGEDVEIAKRKFMPFNPNEHILFNIGGYPSFMIPALLILIIQQTLLIGIGILGGTRTERNKNHSLNPNDKRYRGIFRVIFGKLIAFLLTYIPIVIYVLLILPKLFHLPQLFTSYWIVIGYVVPFLISTILLGLTISVFFRNRENSIPFFLFMSIPFLLLSGITWPKEAMPEFWRYFSYLVPSTEAINGYVRTMSLGASPSETSHENFNLWILSGFYFITTFFAYFWRLKKEAKEIEG